VSLRVLSGGGISVVNWPEGQGREGTRRERGGERKRVSGLGTEEVAHWNLAGLEEEALTEPSATAFSPPLAEEEMGKHRQKKWRGNTKDMLLSYC